MKWEQGIKHGGDTTEPVKRKDVRCFALAFKPWAFKPFKPGGF